MNTAFNTWSLPILGVIFVPYTALFYVIFYTPGVGLVGWDWLWLGLAVPLDVGHVTRSLTTYATVANFDGGGKQIKMPNTTKILIGALVALVIIVWCGVSTWR